MLLREVLSSLVLARKLSPLTVKNYARAIRYFGDHIGADPKVSDLTNQRVNSWLSSCESDYDFSTVNNFRRDLLVVWNHAGDLEECPHPKTRLIRRLSGSRKPTSAWPASWIPRLIQAASEMPGKVKRYPIQRNVYCEAYIRVQVDLLCRPTDMRFLRWSSLSPDRIIEFTQHKTGYFERRQLARETFHAVNRLKGLDREYIFPLSKSCNERLIARIFQAAGIEKPAGESFGHLRHTGGTAISCKDGNDAARRALGHTPGSRVFEKHYLDTSKLPIQQPISWWE